MLTWELSVGTIAGIAAITDDLCRKQIANWIPIFVLLAGLAIKTANAGWQGLAQSVAGAVCGFVVFFVFYLLGGMGGGDIKLMAGFGALLGPSEIWMAAWWAAILGAVIALAWRGNSIPYAPAIVGGVWISFGARS